MKLWAMRTGQFLLAGAVYLSSAGAQAEGQSLFKVELLNKLTGKKRLISIPEGASYIISDLLIKPSQCRLAHGLFSDDRAVTAQIAIYLMQESGGPVLLQNETETSSSAQSHHALEHPIYDVFIIDCAPAAELPNS